jgi:predicted nucleotidyltransferase
MEEKQMTNENIKKIIDGAEYDFLRTNEHLKDKIVFLALGGSHAYGTNIETSDVDIRGCALNRPSDLIGLTNFEQVVNEKTDTTIYSFNKLISLLLNCNPNTIELLGCKPEHYLMMTDVGKELLDNRKLFLSKKAVNSFGGYANQQLRRLENALARDSYPQMEKEKHILGSCMTSMMSFGQRYTSFPDGSIKLYIDKSNHEELTSEIFADINLSHYPLRDYKNIWSDMNNIVKDYGKLNKRNHKKDNAHLNKHAMHLVRLYLMCLDILEKEEIITYREKDHDLLMDIRSGAYQKEDGTYRSEFFEMIDNLEKKLSYAKENTSLPDKPNMQLIEEFVMDVNRRTINE